MLRTFQVRGRNRNWYRPTVAHLPDACGCRLRIEYDRRVQCPRQALLKIHGELPLIAVVDPGESDGRPIARMRVPVDLREAFLCSELKNMTLDRRMQFQAPC